MASSPITSWQIDGETMETVTDFIFLGSKITAGLIATMVTLAPWKESYDKPRQHIKKQRHYFAKKALLRLCWLGTDDVEGLNNSEPYW